MTYIYPSRLVNYPAKQLGEIEGRVIDHLPAVRDAASYALGLGTGTYRGQGSASGTNRGKVAVLKADMAEEIGTELALTVTAPAYSRQDHYQILLPIYQARQYKPHAGDISLRPENELCQLLRTELFISIGFLNSAFGREEVQHYGGPAVTEAEMEIVDKVLRIKFQL